LVPLRSRLEVVLEDGIESNTDPDTLVGYTDCSEVVVSKELVSLPNSRAPN